MSRRTRGAIVPIFDVPLGEKHTPLYLQVYRHLRASILSGSLPSGSRLPSSRTLAADLAVSRNTIEAAFTQLDAEGYLHRRVGSGTFVVPIRPHHPELAHDRRRHRKAAPALSARGRRMSEAGLEADPVSGRAFAACTPGLDVFPLHAWRKLLARGATRLGAAMLGHPDPGGYRPLREAVAGYLGASRGVVCDWRRVLILHGAQQALDLIARLLLDPGDAVWMEDPGYPGARAAFANAGADLVPVPVDDAGLVVQEGIRRAADARLAYVTPSHQYPLGTTLSLSRRLALLDWASRSNAWILEDDYDSEFRYKGRPLAAVQGLDESGRVLYVGTFNKVLFPSIRLGYLVVPEALVEPFTAARSTVDGATGTLMQRILADFITDGQFGAHVRAMRSVYQERRLALLDALEREIATRYRIRSSEAGMHLTLELDPRVDDRQLSQRAAQRGLDVPPLSRYYLGPVPLKGLILNYASLPAPDIRLGVATLRRVLDDEAVPRLAS